MNLRVILLLSFCLNFISLTADIGTLVDSQVYFECGTAKISDLGVLENFNVESTEYDRSYVVVLENWISEDQKVDTNLFEKQLKVVCDLIKSEIPKVKIVYGDYKVVAPDGGVCSVNVHLKKENSH